MRQQFVILLQSQFNVSPFSDGENAFLTEENLSPVSSSVTFLHCVFPPVTDHFPPWRRRAISVKSVAQCDVQIKCICVVQQQCNLMLQICQIGLPMSAFVSENLLCSDAATFCHRTDDVFR